MWKIFVKMAIPFIRMGAEQFKNQDANATGKDDLIGNSLDYCANLLESITENKELPKVPAELN